MAIQYDLIETLLRKWACKRGILQIVWQNHNVYFSFYSIYLGQHAFQKDRYPAHGRS